MELTEIFNTALNYMENIRQIEPIITVVKDASICVLVTENKRIYAGTTGLGVKDGQIFNACAEYNAIMAMIADGENRVDSIITLSFYSQGVCKPCQDCIKLLVRVNSENRSSNVFISANQTVKAETLLESDFQPSEMSTPFIDDISSKFGFEPVEANNNLNIPIPNIPQPQNNMNNNFAPQYQQNQSYPQNQPYPQNQQYPQYPQYQQNQVQQNPNYPYNQPLNQSWHMNPEQFQPQPQEQYQNPYPQQYGMPNNYQNNNASHYYNNTQASNSVYNNAHNSYYYQGQQQNSAYAQNAYQPANTTAQSSAGTGSVFRKRLDQFINDDDDDNDVSENVQDNSSLSKNELKKQARNEKEMAKLMKKYGK